MIGRGNARQDEIGVAEIVGGSIGCIVNVGGHQMGNGKFGVFGLMCSVQPRILICKGGDFKIEVIRMGTKVDAVIF